MAAQKNHRNEAQASRVCVGVVTGAHGVKGMLRVRSFTENPVDLAAYGPVSYEEGGRVLDLVVEGSVKDALLVRAAGVEDRDAALALKGTLLYVPRAALPETEEDEYYHGDLIGLAAEAMDGHSLGIVRGVHNFGAGDILEIGAESGATVMVPFTQAAVPEVDLEGGRVTVDLTAGGLAEEGADLSTGNGKHG
ncbi:MAG: ribosome maturation factor RimM [Alphaproteobacteria bacterium]|nr:ribosome maturation factor RimM [Alphaproteobacteria bacterium]